MPFLFKNYSGDSYGAAGLVAINPGGGRLFLRSFTQSCRLESLTRRAAWCGVPWPGGGIF